GGAGAGAAVLVGYRDGDVVSAALSVGVCSREGIGERAGAAGDGGRVCRVVAPVDHSQERLVERAGGVGEGTAVVERRGGAFAGGGRRDGGRCDARRDVGDGHLRAGAGRGDPVVILDSRRHIVDAALRIRVVAVETVRERAGARIHGGRVA